MSFPRWILPTLVLGVGLTVVGALGSGVIGRDRDARLSAAIGTRQTLAERWAEQQSAAYQDRVALVRQGEVEEVRTFRHDEVHGLLPAGRPGNAPADAERLRFERSQRGGDAYLRRGELGRAIDAYSFAVPDLTDASLRDRLLLRVGRVSLERAVATEADGALDRTVGTRILRELADRPSTALEGVTPVEFLARITLARYGTPEVLPARDELAQRFDTLPVVVVETLARRQPEANDDALATKLAEARTLDRTVRQHRERLLEGRARLVPGDDVHRLVVPVAAEPDLLSLAVVDAPHDASEREAIRVAGFTPDLMVLPSAGGSSPASESESRSPVILDGEPVAEVVVVDPNYAATLVEIARREAGLRVGLYAVLLVVGAALLATWLAIDRQRRLAELKVRLLANVSHELKTPVTSIRMLGELLTDPQLPRDRIEEFGQLVTREAKRLGRRIEDILETARGTGSGAPLDLTPLDVVAITREVVSSLESRIEEREAEVTLQSDAEPLVVPADTDALERVLENLIDNALKYGASEDGSAPAVSVRIERDPPEVRIHVEDRGPGVPTDDRERIFDSFYRSAFQDYGVPGTGLGLAISRSLARRLGGKLLYTRRQSGGSRFTLALPTGDASGNETAAPKPERTARSEDPSESTEPTETGSKETDPPTPSQRPPLSRRTP